MERSASALRLVPRFFWMLLPVVVLVRLIYDCLLQLAPDEAFYWVLSRHPSTGYLDHPPMIAYLIRGSTSLLGSHEIGVRLPAGLLSVGSLVVIVLLAAKVLGDTRAVGWVAIIWLTSPLLAGIGTVFTPDTPAIFFSVCGLACAVLAVQADEPPRWVPFLWLLFGFFTGLAFLSKYTSVLLPAAVGLALLFSRDGRRHLRRPWVYLAGVLALILFLPVIEWNARHHWASFLFQLHHGTTGEEGAESEPPGMRVLRIPWDAIRYLIGQAGVWTPILFGVALVVLVRFWSRYKQLRQTDRVLLWCGTLPLAFFGMMFLKSGGGEVNWPGFAYFPISLLIGRYLAENWDGRRVSWVREGCKLALGITIVLHLLLVPPITGLTERAAEHLGRRLPRSITLMLGNRQLGQSVGAVARENQATVLCNRHQDAGELAFYLPGQPDVWCVSVGSRPTAFDYFDQRPDLAKLDRVLWVGGHEDLFCRDYGFAEERRVTVPLERPGKRQTQTIYVLKR